MTHYQTIVEAGGNRLTAENMYIAMIKAWKKRAKKNGHLKTDMDVMTTALEEETEDATTAETVHKDTAAVDCDVTPETTKRIPRPKRRVTIKTPLT